MAKPTCIYCRVRPGVQRDQVFPDSWYPSTTPTTVQRVTVPSCGPCNVRWKAAEEQLGPNMLMICDRRLHGAAGVHEKLTRSWSVEHARNPEDAEYRRRKALDVLRTMAWPASQPGAPTVEVRIANAARVASPARVFEKPLLNTVAEKFIRGLQYFHTKQMLPEMDVRSIIIPNQHVRMVERRPPQELRFMQAFYRLPVETHLMPGVQYRRYYGVNDTQAWNFLIWDQFEMLSMMQPLIMVAAR